MKTMIATSETHAHALQIISSSPRTINQLLADGKFYDWQSEEISSGGYARSGSDSRDRYNRCYDAAESGGDGSTHAEHINDFRSYGTEIYRQLNRELFHCFGEDLTPEQENELQDALDSAQDEFVLDCDRCEQWHDLNGSLNQQIG